MDMAIGPWSRTKLLIAISLVSALAWIVYRNWAPSVDTTKTYVVGSEGVFPYHEVDAQGRPRGFVTEVVSRAAQRRNIKLKWRSTRTKLPEVLLSGEVDIWPLVSQDAARAFPIIHLSAPWLNNDFAFVALNPALRALANARQVESVAGRDTKVIRALARETFSASRFVPFADRRKAIEAVCRGQVSGAIVELRVAHYFLAAPPPGCEGTVPCFIGLTFRRQQMSLASRQESAAVADLLRHEIGSMAEDGTLDEILLPWAYYQTEEIRAIFKEAQSARHYQWALAATASVAIVGAYLIWLQRRLHRAQLRQQAAERESLAKTQVLRWVSHELRTPLNGMLPAAALLRRELTGQAAAPKEWTDLLQCIQSSASLLNRLVGDLLDAAQFLGPKANPMMLVRTPFDLANLFLVTAREFAFRAEAKGLRFSSEIAGGLPEWVLSDEERLRQVLNNLLANALNHTNTGSICLRAMLPRPLRLRVEVEDTGCGISPEEQQRIFEEFYRAEASRYSSSGLGLGLTISRQIIHLLHGNLGLSSEVGKGSTFYFEIDLLAAEAPPALPAPADPPPLQSLQVLVVDDDALSRRLLSRILVKLGCEVATAENGAIGLEKASTNAFDLILMDCMMPVMDGFEATRQIRQIAKNPMKIAGCTANYFPTDIELCFAAGMDEVIPKPVDISKLRSLVSELRPQHTG